MKNKIILFMLMIFLFISPAYAVSEDEILAELNGTIQNPADEAITSQFDLSWYEEIAQAVGLNSDPVVKTATDIELETKFEPGHISISGSGVHDIQIPWDFIAVYVKDNCVQIDHRDNTGNVDSTWYQMVENVEGYAYLPSVPFSTIEIHAYGTSDAYISNDATDTVAVLNLTTNTITKYISVANEPDAVVVNSAGTRAYVACYDGYLNVINTATNTVIANVSIGGEVLDMCVSPDNAYVYAVSDVENTVYVLNTTTNTVTNTITGYSSPRGITISDDGSTLYVSNYGNGTIAITNIATEVSEYVAVSASPGCLRLSPNGNKLYVPCGGANRVSVVDVASKTVDATVVVGTAPRAVAVTPDGTKVYVTNVNSGTVSVIWTANNTVKTTITVGSDPRGVTVHPLGHRVYVANSGSNTVSAINVTTDTISNTISGFNSPYAFGVFLRSENVPIGSYSASITSGDAPLTVNFTDESSGNPTAWSWNFDDGNTSTSQNASHTFYTAGTYDVSLNVSNVAGYSIYTDTIAVSAPSEPPVSDFNANVTSGLYPLSIQFMDASANNPTTWYWQFGDGSTSTSPNPIHTYTGAGTYTVRLTVSNSYGSDIETKVGYIYTYGLVPPVAGFSANTTSGGAPLAVAFTDLSTNSPTSWHWDFGDNSESTSRNITHIYTVPGVYSVTLTATNADGSDVETKTNYITVQDISIPIAAFNANVTYGVIPLAVAFTDQSENTPASWLWNFGDGSTSTSQNPIHIYNSDGLFTVTLQVTNVDGTDTLVRTSYINAYDEEYTGQPAELAKTADTWDYIANNTSKEYTFATNQAYGLAHWVINGNEVANTTGNNLSYTFTEPGYYNVSVFVENINGNSTMIEYHTRVSRTMATEHVVPLDDTNYNNLMNNVTNLSTDGILTWSVSPFTDQIGRVFYLVLFCLPFLFIWMQTGRLTLVTTLTLITGSLFIGFIPETFKTFIAIAIVLSFASAFYKLSRGP